MFSLWLLRPNKEQAGSSTKSNKVISLRACHSQEILTKQKRQECPSSSTSLWNNPLVYYYSKVQNQATGLVIHHPPKKASPCFAWKDMCLCGKTEAWTRVKSTSTACLPRIKEIQMKRHLRETRLGRVIFHLFPAIPSFISTVLITSRHDWQLPDTAA